MICVACGNGWDDDHNTVAVAVVDEYASTYEPDVRLPFCRECMFGTANRVCTAIIDWAAGVDPLVDRFTQKLVPLRAFGEDLMALATTNRPSAQAGRRGRW
jgi:hypothetical protein